MKYETNNFIKKKKSGLKMLLLYTYYVIYAPFYVKKPNNLNL